MNETLRKTLEIIDNRYKFLEEQGKLDNNYYEKIVLEFRMNELLKLKIQLVENLL